MVDRIHYVHRVTLRHRRFSLWRCYGDLCISAARSSSGRRGTPAIGSRLPRASKLASFDLQLQGQKLEKVAQRQDSDQTTLARHEQPALACSLHLRDRCQNICIRRNHHVGRGRRHDISHRAPVPLLPSQAGHARDLNNADHTTLAHHRKSFVVISVDEVLDQVRN